MSNKHGVIYYAAWSFGIYVTFKLIRRIFSKSSKKDPPCIHTQTGYQLNSSYEYNRALKYEQRLSTQRYHAPGRTESVPSQPQTDQRRVHTPPAGQKVKIPKQNQASRKASLVASHQTDERRVLRPTAPVLKGPKVNVLQNNHVPEKMNLETPLAKVKVRRVQIIRPPAPVLHGPIVKLPQNNHVPERLDLETPLPEFKVRKVQIIGPPAPVLNGPKVKLPQNNHVPEILDLETPLPEVNVRRVQIIRPRELVGNTTPKNENTGCQPIQPSQDQEDDRCLLELKKFILRDHPMKGIRIMYVSNPQKCPLAVKILRQEVRQYNAMGFGYKTFRTGEEGVEKLSFINLGTPSGFCVSIKASQMKEIPRALKQLLEDVEIVKVVRLSTTQELYLKETYNISLKNTLDLSRLDSLMGNALPKVKEICNRFYQDLNASSNENNQKAARACLFSMASLTIMTRMHELKTQIAPAPFKPK